MRKIGLLCLLMALTACVTINIYFPAAEAQKAADKIIDEVWQLKEGQKPAVEAPDAKSEPKAESKPASGVDSK